MFLKKEEKEGNKNSEVYKPEEVIKSVDRYIDIVAREYEEAIENEKVPNIRKKLEEMRDSVLECKLAMNGRDAGKNRTWGSLTI
ncbi:MAG: hypothetical protein ACP5SJ_01645 [Candidatus Micrarchaeia archaeon]